MTVDLTTVSIALTLGAYAYAYYVGHKILKAIKQVEKRKKND